MVKQTRWKSIYVATLFSGLDTIRMSSTFSSAWPYLSSIDSEATEQFFGFSRSVGSVGNIAAGLVAGYISNGLNNTRPSMIVGKIFCLMACIFYVTMNLFPVAPRCIFLLSEVLFGLALGAASISRTHVAMASTEQDRAKAFSMIGIAISLGIFIGPMLILLCSYLLTTAGIELLFSLRLNIYNVPGYISAILSVFSIVLLLRCFDGKMEDQGNVKADQSVINKENHQLISSPIYSVESLKEPCCPIDYLAIFVCFMIKISTTTSMLFTMTLASPYTMTVFKWNGEEAVFYQALTQGFIGVLGVTCNFGYMFGILTKLSERRWILIGLSLKFLFFLATYPWPFIQGSIVYETAENISFTNGTILKHILVVGCNPTFVWCETTPAINVYVYHVFYIVCIGMATPINVLNLDTLYSKILGPIKQGTMQSVFTATGDITSMVGPALISKIYSSFGPKPIWIFNICTMALCILVWLFCYSRMVPFVRRTSRQITKTNSN